MTRKPTHRLLWLLVSLLLVFSFSVTGGWADEATEPLTIMYPDEATLIQWMFDIEGAERAEMDMDLEIPAEGSFSLLGHLDYVASQRNQGSCGNCWAWAGTGVMEVTLDVENSVFDRLSVQYLNSCKTDSWACCGGNLGSFASWYNGEGHAIPWSNTNASFVDAGQNCDTGSAQVSCGSIGTSPDYPIDFITDQTITTRGVAQATAIANIKNVLHQNRAIYFSYCLANNADWNNFRTFWNTQSETVTWNPDFSCGHSWVPGDGGCHAVLLVGYNDNNSANPYWIMVNSWGTAGGGRPNGIFRLDMDMNYSCTYLYGTTSYYSFGFQTLDMDYNIIGDICECDLDNDGDCDMSDYFLFGDDWGRTDCPTTTAVAESKKITEPNDSDTGNPADPSAPEGAKFVSRVVDQSIPDFNAASAPPAEVETNQRKSASKKAAPVEDTDAERAIALPANPTSLWRRLQLLPEADKDNAVLQLEVASNLDTATAAEIGRIESLWNTGNHEPAIEALMSLEGSGLDLAAGISWKTPRVVENAEWIPGDVRIGSRSDMAEGSLDYDAETGNLFAVLRTTDATRVWTVNISTDNGATWQETFQWFLLDPGDTIVDVSASVVSSYLYVGYVAEGDGVATKTAARMRRFAVSNGAVDSGYGYKIVFDKGVAIKEISLNTNTDDSDNRVYYYAILTDFRLIHYWADQLGTTWSEMNTGITDAWQGLDSTWNEGYSSLSGNGRFVSYVGYIIEGAEVANPIVVARRNNLGVWDRTVVDSDPYYDTTTSISAYEDTVITVFEYRDASSNPGIKYQISYDGGSSWYYAYVAQAQSGKHYLNPDVAARNGGGIMAIFQEEVGEPDPLWYRSRPYSGSWSTPEQINEVDVVTGSQVEVEYVPPPAWQQPCPRCLLEVRGPERRLVRPQRWHRS